MMRSESTSAFGQPSETKLTLGARGSVIWRSVGRRASAGSGKMQEIRRKLPRYLEETA